MSRLIDDIRRACRLNAPWFLDAANEEKWARHAARVGRMLSEDDLPIRVIDDVAADYFGCDQEYWNIQRDFPDLTPPLDLPSPFWMEHHMPKRIRSEKFGDSDIPAIMQNGRIGLLMFYGDAAKSIVEEGEMPAEARWILCAELCVDPGSAEASPTQGPFGTICLLIDGAGRAIGVPWMQAWCRKSEAEKLKDLMTCVHPALLAISRGNERQARV